MFVNDYDMVEECALALMNHHVLPGPGGLLTQDEALMQDIYRWIAIYQEEDGAISDGGGWEF